ncbi:MAG: phosphate regulon sensor histidine kinase PhoR [Gammaproteobacteria bacterium]|nr:phosphate regulon sensor histidine kinase PhoR [Gammaproteobacteria bacterium]
MRSWDREVVIALLLGFLITIIGSLTGLFLPLWLIATTVILMWQFYETNRFNKWLAGGAKGKYPPKAKGIWEELYHQVYLLKKREKRQKKKLGKIIDQFRKSTDALPDAAIVLGKHDEIEWVNTAAKQIFGLKQTDRGQRLPNLIRFPAFVNYLNEGNFNESIVINSPMIPQVTLFIHIIKYGGGLRLLLAQDISQLRKMEQIRKDFVANVSHELRTPLTVLKGYLETVQDTEQTLSPVSVYSLKLMQEQTARMQHLVDDLLLLSKLETQPKKSQCVDIPNLLAVIGQEGDRLQKTGRIQMTIDSRYGVMGDELELHSAFANLLTNALKYSADDSPVLIQWRQTGQHLVLSVTDRGEGIPDLEIPRITERFYRINVKRSHVVPGTGLGLAIVKHVLLRHDATLHIESNLGKGSTFSCLFPLARKCINDNNTSH